MTFLMPISLNPNERAPVRDDLDKRSRENPGAVDQRKATGFTTEAARKHYTDVHSCAIE